MLRDRVGAEEAHQVIDTDCETLQAKKRCNNWMI